MYLDNCTQGVTTTKGMIMNVKDGTNYTSINATIISAFQLSKDTLTESYTLTTRNNTAYYCISPTWGNMSYTLTTSYNNSAYSALASIYSDSSTISNGTRTIDIYLTKSSNQGNLTIIQVFGTSGNYMEGAIVKVSQYIGGSWSVISSVTTDYEGKTVAYLFPNDILYKYTVEFGGNTIGDFSASFVTCPAGLSCPPYYVTLSLSTQEYTNWFLWHNNIFSICTNTTNLISCSVSDPSSVALNFNLKVYEDLNGVQTQVCNENGYSSSITLSCTLTNTTSRKYLYRLYGTLINSNVVILQQNTIDYTTSIFEWGESGIIIWFVGNFVFYSIALWWDPIISQLLMMLFNYFIYKLNIIHISPEAWIGFVVVNLVIMYLIMKVKD
jgi:hypothetical protein